MELNLNDKEQNRRNALDELRKLSINPYPAKMYEVTVKSTDITELFEPDKSPDPETPLPAVELAGKYGNISIAGRIMSRRIMGAAAFMELQDQYGKVQVYIKRDEVCPGEDKTMYNTVFKKLLDIGDIVGIRGYAFVTQTGQKSIHAKELTVLSKSLRVLPIVKEKEGEIYDAFSDSELRYRMRYVDLIVNPQVKDTFIKRTKIISTMREYFNSHGCQI